MIKQLIGLWILSVASICAFIVYKFERLIFKW